MKDFSSQSQNAIRVAVHDLQSWFETYSRAYPELNDQNAFTSILIHRIIRDCVLYGIGFKSKQDAINCINNVISALQQLKESSIESLPDEFFTPGKRRMMDAVQYKKLAEFISKNMDTAYGQRAIREGWDGALIRYIKGAAQEDIIKKRNIVVPIYPELLDKLKKGF